MSMKKLYFLLVFAIGCNEVNNIHALSIKPNVIFTSRLEQAAPLSITEHDIHVYGLVGNFKLTLENTSRQPLNTVVVTVTANDSKKVSEIIFSRIYREIFWGGDVFNFPSPPILPDGESLTAFTGVYTEVYGDDLPPGGHVDFDSIVLGNPGLELYFQAYASLPDGTHYALPIDSTTVEWKY